MSSASSQQLPAWGKLIASVLLILMLGFAIGSMRGKAPTIDEVVYLAAGHIYLTTGDFEFNIQHPPLTKQLVGIPLLFLRLSTRYQDLARSRGRSWAFFEEQQRFARRFLYEANQNADQIVFWGRIPIVVLALCLGVLVFKWGFELYGVGAGLLGLTLYVFDPNILAHARLATTDLGVTLFTFLAIYRLWRFFQRPTGINLLFCGVALGLALLSKYSALLLFPTFALLGLIYWRAHRQRLGQEGQESIDRLWSWQDIRLQSHCDFAFTMGLIFVVSVLVVIAGYGFTVRPVLTDTDMRPTVESFLASALPSRVQSLQPALLDMLETVPIPGALYVLGLGTVFRHSVRGHPAFLMGQYSNTGWWYYYIVAYFLKTPSAFLLLLIMSVVTWAVQQRDGISRLIRRRTEKLTALSAVGAGDQHTAGYFLLVPVLLFFLVSTQDHINTGYRHILPVQPFLHVLVGRLAVTQSVQLKTRIAILSVLVSWYVLSSVGIYPHYLAYFNELVGGPANGYRYLVDSNLDWGQDLKGLKRYMDTNQINSVKLSYFGLADPAYYGIRFECLSCMEPSLNFDNWASDREVSGPFRATPGVYAISATNLQGVLLADKNYYRWFREREPADMIGYSILIYAVPPTS